MRSRRSLDSTGAGSLRAWTPRDLTGNRIWLPGDRGVTLVSGNVSSWNDASLKGNSFAQAVAANRPASSTIGSRAAASFDGINSFLSNANVFTSFTGDITIAMVTQMASTAVVSDLVTGDNSSATFLRFTAAGFDFRDDTPTYGVIATGSGHDTNPHVVLFQSSAGAPGAQQIYVDGVSAGTAAGNWGTSLWAAIGQRSGVERLNGKLGELVMLNRILSTAERTRLTRYLGNRFGITVP